MPRADPRGQGNLLILDGVGSVGDRVRAKRHVQVTIAIIRSRSCLVCLKDFCKCPSNILRGVRRLVLLANRKARIHHRTTGLGNRARACRQIVTIHLDRRLRGSLFDRSSWAKRGSCFLSRRGRGRARSSPSGSGPGGATRFAPPRPFNRHSTNASAAFGEQRRSTSFFTEHFSAPVVSAARSFSRSHLMGCASQKPPSWP